MAKTADALIAVAAKEVGYSRYTDPEQGTKYGRWYAKLTNSPWFGTTGVPYCAMFASWCLAQLGIPCTGCPTASCTSGLLTAARRAGKLKRAANAKPGDLVLFNWNGAGYTASEADHVGIVVSNTGYLSTIEGNVSGAVARRTRAYSTVVGCITPDFDATPEPSGKLAVDGVFGTLTVKALQESLQSHGYYKGRSVDGGFGHYTKLALQQYLRKLGYYGMTWLLDGWFGPASVKALQTYLRKLGYYGTEYLIDGDWGEYTTMALQRALNDGKF